MSEKIGRSPNFFWFPQFISNLEQTEHDLNNEGFSFRWLLKSEKLEESSCGFTAAFGVKFRIYVSCF